MRKEEFIRLKPGDVVSLHGQKRTVKWTDKDFNGAVWMVEYEEGDNTKINDPWLDKIKIVHSAQRPMINTLSFHITGIHPDSKAWDFVEEACADIIAQYGGEIVEID